MCTANEIAKHLSIISIMSIKEAFSGVFGACSHSSAMVSAFDRRRDQQWKILKLPFGLLEWWTIA